jgi:hypothetical protein
MLKLETRPVAFVPSCELLDEAIRMEMSLASLAACGIPIDRYARRLHAISRELINRDLDCWWRMPE